jgi:hypothetical protein
MDEVELSAQPSEKACRWQDRTIQSQLASDFGTHYVLAKQVDNFVAIVATTMATIAILFFGNRLLQSNRQSKDDRVSIGVVLDSEVHDEIEAVLHPEHIDVFFEGSLVWDITVPGKDAQRAADILRGVESLQRSIAVGYPNGPSQSELRRLVEERDESYAEQQ